MLPTVAAVARFEAHAQRIAAAARRSNAARFAPEHFRQTVRALVDKVTSSPP